MVTEWPIALLTLLAALVATPVAALDNGLARTPPMGFSTWSVFKSSVSDALVRELADALHVTGLARAGYNYLLIDDGWYAAGCPAPGCLPFRNASGHLNADATKFPRGLAAVAAYVHSRGLKLGLWFGHAMCSVVSNDTATATAAVGAAAPVDYAALDAAFFAANGIDAVKHDNCIDVANTSTAIAENYERYARLGRALNATGRPVMYDVVLQVAHARETPSYDLGYLWSPEVYGKEAVQRVANMWWSLPVNKFNCWSCCVSGERIVDDSRCTSLSGTACRRGLLPMLDAQDMGTPGFSSTGHWDYGGPGGWNHLDQLAVCTNKSWYGPGFTHTEQVAQMSLWSVLASPLIISMDVRNVSAQCIALVTNPRAIAVHQDALGAPGRRLKNIGAVRSTVADGVGGGGAGVAAQLWGRPLSSGGVAVVFFNRGEAPIDISATCDEMGLPRRDGNVTITDVWTGHAVVREHSPQLTYTAKAVPPHGVQFVTLMFD
mgnify:FL=1